MSIAAAPAAAEVVGARAAAAGGTKAATGKAAGFKASGLPRDPGAHAAKLRAQGMDNQKIRKALKDMGYDAATAANVAPGNDAPVPSAAASSSPTPSSGSATGPSLPRFPSGGSGSGLLLGLVLYPVALAFLRDGVPGMKAWFNAKFLNKVSTPGAKPSTKSGAVAT